MQEFVILVDDNDNEIGVDEKLKAHEEGKLHRAFSIFIFNSKNELLLQRRALNKYHSAGLWTNTCCSHPRPDEDITISVHRRLKEEMGFDCDLKEIFTFKYKVPFTNGLTEHEFDHVFIGHYEENPNPNPEEVDSFEWMNLPTLSEKMKTNGELYTEWLKICFEELKKYI
ncbi:MAG: isopentenyl-diphosphate Delta-isomerase [Candidatus Paceibacterota bacterium]|jgi:isopentenyl-diphosphate delta-isomerase